MTAMQRWTVVARALAARTLATGALAACVACAAPAANPDRVQRVTREEDAPERFLPADLATRPDSANLELPGHYFDLDEEGEKDSLPTLPYGMTVDMLRDGDRLFHGTGGCVNCHGSEAQGLAARGKTLTVALKFISGNDWHAIDSLILVGMPDRQTRTTIAMPPRGQSSDLDADETRAIAAYVWAINQVKGEPWLGGHAIHAPHDWRASARTSIP